ncbi:MAG: hypothetical protein RBR98_02735, partial [Candidatus Moranbacteria bacterium]|nr:hypothetical protein [Candidatus Moranbacteria bacterium]
SPEMLNATVLIRMLLYKIYKIHFQYILYKYNNLGTLADNHKIKYRYLNLSNSTNECIEAKNLYSELSDSAEISSIKRIASVSDALAVEKNWPNTKYPKLLGEKYFSHAQSTAEFIDISNKYNFLDSKCEVKAVEGIETFSDIELYNNKWSKTNVGLLVESKAIQVCSRDELKLFINLFPKEFTISAKKEYIASAPSYREFIRTAWIEYPDLINLPQTFDETDLANVKEHYKNLLNNESFFKSEQLSSLRNNLLDISLNSIYSKAKDNNDTLLLLADILDEEEWLHARNRENGTKDYIDIVTERIKYNLRIEEFIKIQVDGEIEDKMNFCLKYPSTPEAESFTNELNKFVNNYVQITDVTHWSAKGNSSWLNDLAETSRDFIHGGQAYNFFIMGLLKNYADIPVKITLRVDLMRYKTCGVSIFQSTSEEIITDKNHLVIPPKESMPFLMVFKDLSEGTVVGSGLLSAGCTYSPLDIKTISKTLYNGEISRKQMLNHIAFVKDIVNKGNVSRTLSPNERAEQWVNEKFGMEPTRKTTLRIKNASGGGLTVYSIKGGSKNEISKNREIDKEDYEDFDLYGGTYKVLTSLGEVSVDIKGRMTHLIVEKKKFRVSYDDID